jgi:hypothetical protein
MCRTKWIKQVLGALDGQNTDAASRILKTYVGDLVERFFCIRAAIRSSVHFVEKQNFPQACSERKVHESPKDQRLISWALFFSSYFTPS